MRRLFFRGLKLVTRLPFFKNSVVNYFFCWKMFTRTFLEDDKLHDLAGISFFNNNNNNNNNNNKHLCCTRKENLKLE